MTIKCPVCKEVVHLSRSLVIEPHAKPGWTNRTLAEGKHMECPGSRRAIAIGLAGIRKF